MYSIHILRNISLCRSDRSAAPTSRSAAFSFPLPDLDIRFSVSGAALRCSRRRRRQRRPRRRP